MDKRNSEVIIPAEVRSASTEDQDFTFDGWFKLKD